uniref:Uncharacterized protein n=1 Tax=Anopheles christyi TaxID=43041 RepID=A0A182JWL9_9DIPT
MAHSVTAGGSKEQSMMSEHHTTPKKKVTLALAECASGDTSTNENDSIFRTLENFTAQNGTVSPKLLSLTSHLSFGSHDKRIVADAIAAGGASSRQPIREETSDHESDSSFGNSRPQNDSKMSGVSPFFSAEQNVSVTEEIKTLRSEHTIVEEKFDSSSYYTCNSDVDGKTSSSDSCESVKQVRVRLEPVNGPVEEKENIDSTNSGEEKSRLKDPFECLMVSKKLHRNYTEDSGVSSRKSDISNIPCELSAIEKVENHSNNSNKDFSSDFSRSYSMSNITEISHSPVRNGLRGFKRPEYVRGIKRGRHLGNRVDSLASDVDGTSTGLTQEIDVLDICSEMHRSTPKKRKAATPIKGVLKVRSLSDDEMQTGADVIANVMFSTPVSSQKIRREGGQLGKLKSTRFQLPSSIDQSRKGKAYSEALPSHFIKMPDESVMSPICTNNATAGCDSTAGGDVIGPAIENTPKAVKTPF